MAAGILSYLNGNVRKCPFSPVWAYADSEGPDQPAHPRSLIWAFTVRFSVATVEYIDEEQRSFILRNHAYSNM